MLNSVTPARMTPENRRRQLVVIGLRKFVERPVQELSLDDVAAGAGVSRGLLFHYCPTKTDFHRAVVEAAGRRVLRTAARQVDATGQEALRQITEAFVRQIRRRRASYVALVFGQGPAPEASGADPMGTLRSGLTDLVIARAGLDPAGRPVVHGWVAYVEDRALEAPADSDVDALVAHCLWALNALGAPTRVAAVPE